MLHLAMINNEYVACGQYVIVNVFKKKYFKKYQWSRASLAVELFWLIFFKILIFKGANVMALFLRHAYSYKCSGNLTDKEISLEISRNLILLISV